MKLNLEKILPTDFMMLILISTGHKEQPPKDLVSDSLNNLKKNKSLAPKHITLNQILTKVLKINIDLFHLDSHEKNVKFLATQI